MTIPVREPWAAADPELGWSALDSEQKRERLLRAAGRVFARGGLDAPMPTVAAEAGAGVASLYRQFPSKHELLAALVVRRLEQFADATDTASERGGDRWTALTEMLRSVVERDSADDFLGEARALVADHPAVAAAMARTGVALERLLADARAEGRLRTDATITDVHLLLVATRAAKKATPDAWQRMLALLIDALDARRS
jgi:AcrR family transcriptional regulator